MVHKSSLELFSPVPTPEGFREPTDGTLRYRPDGAMPANPYLDAPRQKEIDDEFQKLFDNPPEGTPKQFARMLQDDHMINEQRRKMLNFENFEAWRATGEVVPDELEESMDHVIRGTASVEEVLDFALQTNLEAFEVGKVTHPYRRRLQYVAPFRKVVDNAILERGGEVYGKSFPYRSIDIYPHVTFKKGEPFIHGFIVPYKRDVGDIPLLDGSGVIHVVERQLSAFRADEASGFNEHVLKMMKYDPFKWNTYPNDEAYQDALKTTGCRGFIERAVQFDSLENFVVPISTTIYGYKEFYKKETDPTMAQQAIRSVMMPGFLE